MLPVARLMDIGVGICTIGIPHADVGYVLATDPSVLVNYRPCAKITDKVNSTCGGQGTIITGNFTTLVKNKPIARITSVFVGTFTGVIITGSTTVLG